MKRGSRKKQPFFGFWKMEKRERATTRPIEEEEERRGKLVSFWVFLKARKDCGFACFYGCVFPDIILATSLFVLFAVIRNFISY